MKRLLATVLLSVILTACSKEHTGPTPELFLKCTTQERPMGPYKHIYAKGNSWEMYKQTEWAVDGSYQQVKGEFCEIISE